LGVVLFGRGVGARQWRIIVWRGHRTAPSDRVASFGGDGPWATAHPCDMSAILRLLGWWLLGGVQHCLVASGGGGALEKQLDNQLDCWWKAKGGVDERPVTVTNSDESQPPLAFGDDVWKAEENGRVVVCRHHDCHRQGGARGGGDIYGEDKGKRGKT